MNNNELFPTGTNDLPPSVIGAGRPVAPAETSQSSTTPQREFTNFDGSTKGIIGQSVEVVPPKIEEPQGPSATEQALSGTLNTPVEGEEPKAPSAQPAPENPSSPDFSQDTYTVATPAGEHVAPPVLGDEPPEFRS